MEAQARSHRVRLTELQESCCNKVRQVQQMHREQLLAAQSTSVATLAAAAVPAASTVVTGVQALQYACFLLLAEAAKHFCILRIHACMPPMEVSSESQEKPSTALLCSVCCVHLQDIHSAFVLLAEEIHALTTLFEAEQAKRAAECSTLQDKLMSAEHQQEALRRQLESRSGRLHSLQQQEQQSKQALAESTAAQSELTSNQAILQERCASLQAQVVELRQRSTSTSQTDSAAVFQVLEQQLISLTGLVRQKEQQIAALQQTVQQQCDERTMMHIKIMQLNAVTDGTPVKQRSSIADTPLPLEQRSSLSSQAGQLQMPVNAQASAAKQSCTPSRIVPDAKVGVDRAAQRKDRLNRLASASEQQQGKSGLLGRIMATSSTTGKTAFD